MYSKDMQKKTKKKLFSFSFLWNYILYSEWILAGSEVIYARRVRRVIYGDGLPTNLWQQKNMSKNSNDTCRSFAESSFIRPFLRLLRRVLATGFWFLIYNVRVSRCKQIDSRRNLVRRQKTKSFFLVFFIASARTTSLLMRLASCNY